MDYYADLHVHSKYSLATSKNLDLENLCLWAQRKGISVVGTGDFTHPTWLNELQEKLIPAEPGLFKLPTEIEREIHKLLPINCQGSVRFLFSTEVSTIYKKNGKTRRIHHLIYAPDLHSVKKINGALSQIGRLDADGRPILGLDSRHLLEIILSASEDCFLVPAHIWTPWYSVLGSQSGFDSVEECYEDLANHIFAVETGLSSDPEMNRRVAQLNRYRLVSNSDAHSPAKLGRESTLLQTDLSYFAIKKAFKTGVGLGGTVEFFPEEGKYHLDGHRKCGIRFTPNESKKNQYLCPVCQKNLTLGVLHRVEELSCYIKGNDHKPIREKFINLIPLDEIIAQTMQASSKSKQVQTVYETLLANLGNELTILIKTSINDIKKYSSTTMAQAIACMRKGQVHCDAGYDGAYGRINIIQN